MTTHTETKSFQTEVKQMLHLVVHALYSNKEIFLRELISNASDALDKLRFLALSDASLYEADSDLKITITVDEANKMLTIKDNGVGMSYDEIIENLGTIAKSGTKAFLSQLTGEQAKDSHLIGQFGVGFYSALIVADKITVKSRRAGLSEKEGVVWESSGEDSYTVAPEAGLPRGTEITLHLKEDASEFLSDWRLRGIISKYSDHICWPIVMKKIETPDEENKEKASEPEYETVNKATALWTLPKSEISDEEYCDLYKHLSHDYENPLVWAHNHVEGKQDYIALLYIPKHASFDLWQQEAKHGLKLYVKRVFIMDDAKQFMPRYLRFVKGIIDSGDLPLNVSREILQDNKLVESIRTASAKRVLSMLEALSKDNPLDYQTFWDTFGLVLKEGPVEDFANREKIATLLRFTSTHTDTEKQTVTLDEYISRMKPDQDKIYYLTASSYNAAKYSPHLEILKKKGLEVLLLTDRIDEWLMGYLTEYAGKKFQSVSKGKLDLSEPEADESVKEQEKSLAPMLQQIEKILGDRVKGVQLTARLTDSPVCVVADEHDMGLEMQRILQSAGQKVPEMKPIFEINPEHALIKKLHAMTDDGLFSEWTLMLFEQALLAEGGHLDNPADFVRRMNRLLEKTV